MGSINKEFVPDFIVSPGEILQDELEAIGMSQAELSARTGLTKKTINEIIKGKAVITPNTALLLNRAVGRSERFWLNLEAAFQSALAREIEKKNLDKDLHVLKYLPVKELIKRSLIQKRINKHEQLIEILKFFGVKNLNSLQDVSKINHMNTAFRKSGIDHTKRYWSILAWLRQGENLYKDKEVSEFNKAEFEKALLEARELSGEPLEKVIKILPKLCEETGVVLMFVNEFPGSGVCGATRWHNKTPVIMLSCRYKSNDTFWFTFFHEVGHILKHGRKNLFIEWERKSDAKTKSDEENELLNQSEHLLDMEKEADEYASDHLIEKQAYINFIAHRHFFAKDEIIRFAKQNKIHPSIVLGRLQHEGLVPYNHHHDLKIKYDLVMAQKSMVS